MSSIFIKKFFCAPFHFLTSTSAIELVSKPGTCVWSKTTYKDYQKHGFLQRGNCLTALLKNASTLKTSGVLVWLNQLKILLWYKIYTYIV